MKSYPIAGITGKQTRQSGASQAEPYTTMEGCLPTSLLMLWEWAAEHVCVLEIQCQDSC